ncbi:MAG TPA: TIM barrel protein [Candidatus Eisenbacteria bacterium]|nr:TIM barrel protein [Candidatus Eisenbacteria bacterium]
MNRRQFLKSSAALGGLVSLSPSLLRGAETTGKKRDLKKGYMLGTFPGKDLPLLEKFKILKAAGFDGVEPPSHLDQDEVIRARDESGLLIPSVSCGKHSRALSEASAVERAKGVEGVKQALRDAKRYGASSILVVPGDVSKETSYADAYQRVQTELRKTVPLAEELGVKLALENVWNHFLLSPLEAARFVDEFKSPAVGWHFDVGNVIFLGQPEQWIRILGKRIQKLHIKEYSRKKLNERGLRAGFNVEYLEGDNDWPAVMKALDEIGYHGWGIAEPAWRPEGVEPEVRLKQIAEKMDQIFAK